VLIPILLAHRAHRCFEYAESEPRRSPCTPCALESPALDPAPIPYGMPIAVGRPVTDSRGLGPLATRVPSPSETGSAPNSNKSSRQVYSKSRNNVKLLGETLVTAQGSCQPNATHKRGHQQVLSLNEAHADQSISPRKLCMPLNVPTSFSINTNNISQQL
jgi:hypothetical protein